MTDKELEQLWHVIRGIVAQGQRVTLRWKTGEGRHGFHEAHGTILILPYNTALRETMIELDDRYLIMLPIIREIVDSMNNPLWPMRTAA